MIKRPPIAWLVLLVATTVHARTVEARTPLPPHGDRSVHDLADVLPAEQEARLEASHKQLFEKTGVAIVIVVVPRLEDETIDELGLRVGTEWGVGKKGQDRGIVVALAVADRRITIQTGYGVESYLPDGRVGAILDEYVVPYLRKGDLATAMLNASVALTTASAKEFHVTLDGTPALQTPRPARGRSLGAHLLLLILIILGGGYLAIRHPALFLLLLMRGGGGFGRGGFGGGNGFGGFGGGGFGGGGASRGY